MSHAPVVVNYDWGSALSVTNVIRYGCFFFAGVEFKDSIVRYNCIKASESYFIAQA